MVDADLIQTDVLIVGGGVAALRAAISAREAGADVLVCCKGIAGRSGNTVPSTADISAYVPELGLDDSEETFSGDTLGAGGSIADDELVHLLARRSGPAVLDLERHGIQLLRNGEEIDRTRGAGHSRARTYRADSKGLGPNKGLALSVPLAARGRELGVRFLDRTPIVHLAGTPEETIDAIAVDLDASAPLAIAAGAGIVAAGGASHLFARTNGTADATGDVIALAMHAGALARDMEFVQWHPTRMDTPVPLFLTNGLLADGAVFRDAAGREFMGDYDPRANLAPRDVLAKAIYLEASSGRGVNGGVYLDCSPVPDDRIALRHSYLAETLHKHEVDFPRQWLIVSPATHFLMGGLVIDRRAASTLPGLFAAGESAGGIHGANRLGGNAFCEGLVFGTIAGESAAAHARTHPAGALRSSSSEAFGSATSEAAPDLRPAIAALWRRVRTTMWEQASLVRSAGSLGAAAELLDQVVAEAGELRAVTAADAARLVDLRAGLDCARTIVAAAAFREESRGAHWRTDFSETSPHWLGSILVHWPSEKQSPTLEFRPKQPASDGEAAMARARAS